MIGKTVQRYLIRERLGGGGMGVVFKAEDMRLGREVALKFLPPQFSDDSEAKERFIREARAASKLDHPNICTIYDVGESDTGQLFLVMAYYEGETLKKRLEKGPLSVDEAIVFMRQMAAGLGKSHERNILHRDIKPGNILITEEDETIKILDFGLAKITGEAAMSISGLTQGTPAYMAPERLMGKDVDARVDLWALGVVFYECLAGERPFQGKNVPDIIQAVHTVDPPAIDKLREDVPAPLAGVVKRLLKRNPKQRYGSCGELMEALDAAAPQKGLADGQHRLRLAWLLGGLILFVVLAVFFLPGVLP